MDGYWGSVVNYREESRRGIADCKTSNEFTEGSILNCSLKHFLCPFNAEPQQSVQAEWKKTSVGVL